MTPPNTSLSKSKGGKGYARNLMFVALFFFSIGYYRPWKTAYDDGRIASTLSMKNNMKTKKTEENVVAAAAAAVKQAFTGAPPAAEANVKENEQDNFVLKDSDRIFSAAETDEWKRTLYQRLDVIRTQCGDLCQINDLKSLENHTVGHGHYFRTVKANVNCQRILTSQEIDAADPTVPYPIPDELLPYYQMHGLVNVIKRRRYVDVYLGGEQKLSPTWTKEYIAKLTADMDAYVANKYRGWARYLFNILIRHNKIRDKRVLVLGTETPWVETLLLMNGAAKVLTLEYGSLNTTHPQLETMTPEVFRKAYADGTLGEFDAVVSYSSMEHSGLGRYGDALNPWGDLLGLARAWCVTKPGGYLYLAVPTGVDHVVFNGQRMYGKHRWPLLAANWQQIRLVDEDETLRKALDYNTLMPQWQPVYMFQKQ